MQEFDKENRLTSVTTNGQTTHFKYDANGQRTMTLAPSGLYTFYPFPNVEEEVNLNNQDYTLKYSYSAAGVAVAVRTKAKQGTTTTNTLHYLYSDHLGSTSTVTNSSGGQVQQTRFLPFGGYWGTPTQTVTDRGYTGHLHNDEVGLIYMNARFYVPSIGRFASADTIVPNPLMPQSYNRYAYVYNNPIKLTDPSGHCGGLYLNGEASEDQDCWDFLYNDFCTGGSADVCTHWTSRLDFNLVDCGFGVFCMAFSSAWTKDELLILRDSIANATTALTNAGYNGEEILSNISFYRSNVGYSLTFPSSHIGLDVVDEQTIWHEMGHTISFRNGYTSQYEYFNFAQGFASTPYYDLENFCYKSYCTYEYNEGFEWFAGFYTGEHPEYWADAFSAWVYMETYALEPNYWIKDTTPNWNAISKGVEWSLQVTFEE